MKKKRKRRQDTTVACTLIRFYSILITAILEEQMLDARKLKGDIFLQSYCLLTSESAFKTPLSHDYWKELATPVTVF